MRDSQFGIVDAAKGLARNPPGIIALFIVLVYGFASLVTAFAGSFTHEERLPLIYFLVPVSCRSFGRVRVAGQHT